ncbi:hypothetical protein HF576_11090 [Microbacterium sp. CFH 90308]|uniref:DUF3558 domain-containing protein n=1 Tax=Microbacterium salsuginis TaxID=2722803 RepID=A0ABX1KE89_9MICO|nr:hypothetical protein [Microbacterium sp. CFH 90308]NLP84399.1 hypothetical protein [Microbacterium sp. CFH 90308]
MALRASRLAAAAASVLVAALLSACAPDPGGADPDDTGRASSSPTSSASGTASPGATPTPSATASADIPDDCLAIVDDDVLSQLDGIPLNAAAFAPTGPQSDGSLICVWRDPAADTTGLITTISYLSRGPELDMLNQLADEEGFTCYTPDGGTRCEKTWQNETYPVTDGRTLFWRDDILVDTRFSNLAPTGYTASIVESLFG